jgi:hypothetical protein
MTLAAGTRLGPYEVDALIGAGGPSPLRTNAPELRRGLAEAQRRIR